MPPKTVQQASSIGFFESLSNRAQNPECEPVAVPLECRFAALRFAVDIFKNGIEQSGSPLAYASRANFGVLNCGFRHRRYLVFARGARPIFRRERIGLWVNDG